MNIVALAGSLPRDPQFRAWASEFISGHVTVDDAAAFIRITCGIESRRELATNKEAAQLFHQLIRKMYLAWNEEQF